MIFQYTYQQILDNNKTATRRVINPGEVLLENPTRLVVSGRTKWQVGKSYAIQPGRRKKAVGRIEITGIYQERLGQMTAEDALAEGFASLEEFQQTWIQIHGHYDPNQSVWVVTFVKEATLEEKARNKRLEREIWLNQTVVEQRKQLTAAGHQLSDWELKEELHLVATCTRCTGTVAVDAREICSIIQPWPLNADMCLADNPERMEAERAERGKLLARVYNMILSDDWGDE